MAVAVEHIVWVELFVAVVGAPVTVTETDETLTVLHDGATAVAVITSPETNAGRPIFVHAPEVTVVVPREIPALNNSMIVPLGSELVPLIVVEPEQIGELTTGATEGVEAR